MNDDEVAMPALIERHDGFNYGYRMKCECGGISYISGVKYHARQSIDALMRCDYCGGTIRFGPAVAALRDVHDPALDDNQVNQLAWYHTSIHSDWPATTYTGVEQPGKALHVGTYEAAIENMLRHMREKDDAASQFYLYRVALAVEPGRVNDGYRDENHELAAQLTREDLQREELMAVRYLNVHEAVGSLSLAVLPEAIAYVQTCHLPASTLASDHSNSLISFLDQVQVSLEDLCMNAPDTSTVRPNELRLMKLGIRPDPDGIGAASAAHDSAHFNLLESVTDELIYEYFSNASPVSPIVREGFEKAITRWRRGQAISTVRHFADFFAASSIAITRPNAVAALVASSAPRRVAGAGDAC